MFLCCCKAYPREYNKRGLHVARLLALAKHSSGNQLIIIGELLYQLVNKTFCFRFRNAFLAHLSFH
jgi:hypothetical protein